MASTCCDLTAYPTGHQTISDQQKRLVPTGIVYFLGKTYEPNGRILGQRLVFSLEAPLVTDPVRKLISDYYIGNVVLNLLHFQDASQVSQLIQELQSLAKAAGHTQPLLIGLELEGGLVVNNTDSLKLTQFPSALSLTACNSSATVQRVGEAIGNELSPIGINWVYGPVLDIVSDLTEPFDASSRFGGDASTVGSLALAFIKGLRKSRIASCVMGTLATTIEETYASLIQDDSKEDVARGTDPEGFEALWRLRGENCLDSLQLSSSVHSLHYPIQLGRSIQVTIRSILRERLDFQGPVLLDCSSLPLESIECPKHAPVRAFLGDCDMVRLSNDHDLQIASIEAIYAAAESGSLRESASANAAARVSTMKDQCSSWDLAFAERKDLSAILTVNADLAQATYRESITVLSTGPSPLLNLPTTAVLVLLAPTLLSQALPASLTNTVASDPFEPLGRALSRSHPRIRHVPYTISGGLTSTHMTFLNLASAVVLVLCNASTAFSEAQDELASAVQTAVLQLESVPGSKVIRKVVLAAGDPRDLRGDWTGWWASCCYEYTRGALNAAAEVISGERVATGVLPLQLP